MQSQTFPLCTWLFPYPNWATWKGREGEREREREREREGEGRETEGLAQLLRPSCTYLEMVLYSVYKARFLTRRGTGRSYVGFIGNASRREDRLQLGEVVWLKPMRPGSLTLEVLHEDLAAKSVALAQEALAAAKAIHADPDHVRGGPWLSLRLSKANKAEVAAVAKCKDLASLPQVAAELGPRSRLAMHLKELKFERAAS